MLIKTEAICIKNTRFGESSVICKMFTLEHGLSSFIIQGINRKSSLIKPSHISPGNILELVIYQKPHSQIQRVKELKVQFPLLQVHVNMTKNVILQFILEIIAKTNEEDFKDEVIFYFLKENIQHLEIRDENLNYTPLLFLCNYLKFSGWFPNLEIWDSGYKFNIQEGRFESTKNNTNDLHLVEALESKLLFELLSKIKNDHVIDLKVITHKKEMFKLLIQYYEIHILKGRKIKSPSILSEIIA
jgi:DNA repair protein RecO (recombination protein O)